MEDYGQDRERYNLMGATIAGGLIVGPQVIGAYQATAQANELQAAREAATAAGAEIAQQPYLTSQNIGAAGEIQISRDISKWIPLALAFIVVMYLVFKD